MWGWGRESIKPNPKILLQATMPQIRKLVLAQGLAGLLQDIKNIDIIDMEFPTNIELGFL